MVINLLTDVARLLQTLPLSSSTLSTKSSIIAYQAVSLAHQLIPKLYLKLYKNLINPLACISTYSSGNVFPIWYLSEKSSWSREGPWVKRQKNGWLDAVKKPTLKTLTSAFFHQSSIEDRSFSIMRDLGQESRLGLDNSALTIDLMNGKIKRVKWFTLVSDPTINVRSGRLIPSSNMSVIMKAIERWWPYPLSRSETTKTKYP